MDLNTNQKGNVIVFVIFFAILIMFGFWPGIGWSDSYILSVIPGFVGAVLGGVIRLLLVAFKKSYIQLVGFGAGLAILVPVIGVGGVGIIGGIAEAGLVGEAPIGSGAYAATFLISGFTGLFSFDFNQLE